MNLSLPLPFLLLALALVLAPLAAQAATPSPNETCFGCHADKEAKGSEGKSIAVDAGTFTKSVHGEMQLACTDCHRDVSTAKLPHAEKLKPVECATCHEKPAAEYRETVHAKARANGRNVAATCVDCHGVHDIARSKDPASRTNHANLDTTCGKCHGNDAVVQQAKLPGGNIVNAFHDSIHSRVLKGPAGEAAPTCTNCHGAHSIRAKTDEQSPVNRARVPDTCGSCHSDIKAAFQGGQHGKLRQEGNLAAPGCNDCHTAHRIRQHDDPRFQTAAIDQCGTCHEQYLTSYRDTFHGQVTALGYTTVATCASCHGAHQVLPASDPKSKVSPQHRLETCRACHQGASANFANWDPHANRHDRARNPGYFYAAKFMDLLLIGVFGFFGIHTVFWLGRSLKDTIARRRDREGKRTSESES